MTKAEKEKIKSMLENKVNKYLSFVSRDDYPNKPCVCRCVETLQHTVFNLAEYMWEMGFITWEECCEYWSKVDVVDKDEKCVFTECGANENGVCRYVVEKRGGRQ